MDNNNDNKNKKINLIEKLRQDSFYQAALSNASNENERKKISDFVESIVSKFAEILEPAVEKIESDPSSLEDFEKNILKDQK